MSERAASVSRESSLRRRKTTSAYHYRRRSKALSVDQYNAELRHVLGLTLKTNCSFSCDPYTGLLAYPAGCVIVLYNPKRETQSHIFNPGQKTITCLKFSHDGCHVVTGEAGHRPCVRVFSVADRCQVASYSSHKFGVSCVAFSPSGKYITSIGFQHDNVINVWDWKKNKLAASNKVSTKIKSLAFSPDGSHFITVGNRHVKYWYLEEPSADQTTVPLKGRSAILENLRNHVFCDVICGCASDSQYAFAVTRSGILCQLNCGRTVENYVELKCGSSRSICAIHEMILCSCSCGSVHVFDANTLKFLSEISPMERLRDVEIIAIAIDEQNMWMHCVFDDHSFVVYNVLDLNSSQLHTLHHFHGSCVWDVKVLPCTSECTSLPRGSFLTCSSDGTVRAWQCEGQNCRLLKTIKLHKGIDEEESESSSKHEARCLGARSDGKHLAVGDRSGNLHVYNLDSYEKLAYIPTHEGDVLCVDYSQNGDMLASASRDRCVHAFDSCYNPTHTVADHSAAVTAVKFAQNGNDYRLITCGSDKSLYFCSITNNNGKTDITREQHFVEKHSMSDMAVLDDTVLLACGCNLSEYDVIGGKLRRTFRGSEASVAILRVAVNNHRTLVATSCADKHICVLNFSTGDCLCVLSGHSEVAVALTFDGENRLLSASADGCVFIWSLIRRVPDDLKNLQLYNGNSNSNVTTPDSPDLDKTAYFVRARPTKLPIDEKATPRTLAGESFSALFSDTDHNEEVKTFQATPVGSFPDTTSPYELPTWVTKAISNDNDNSAYPTPRQAMGKWGQRLEADKICEELGNLPLSVDISSIRGSVDAEDDSTSVNDDDISTSTNDADSTCGSAIVEKPLEEECVKGEESDNTLLDDAPENIGATENLRAEESDSSADVAEETDTPAEVDSETSTENIKELVEKEQISAELELKASTENIKISGEVAEEKEIPAKLDQETSTESIRESVEAEENHLVASSDDEDVETTKNTILINHRSLSPEENTGSLQEEIFNVEEGLKSAPTDNIEKDVVLPLPVLENDISDISADISNLHVHVEEDIDVRSLHFKNTHPLINKVNFLPKSNAVNASPNDHELHSTPKSHFTASVSIKLNPSVKSNVLVDLKQPPTHTLTLKQNNFKLTQPNMALVDENDADKTVLSKQNRRDNIQQSTDVFAAKITESYTSPSSKNDADTAALPSAEVLATVDNVSRNLVDQVLLESTNEESTVREPDASDSEHATNSHLLVDLRNDDSVLDSKKLCQNDCHPSTSERVPLISNNLSSETNGDKAPKISTVGMNSTPSQDGKSDVKNTTKSRSLDYKTGRSSSMPPAFAEFIANLTKKKPNSPRNSFNISNSSSNGQVHANSSAANSRTKLQCRVYTAGRRVVENEENKEINEIDRYSRGDSRRSSSIIHPETSNHSPSLDNADECQKVSEDLMKMFNHAVALYRKQKVLHDSDDGLSNGSLDGYNKLLRTFQIMHSRLNCLKFLSNSVDCYPTPDSRNPTVDPRQLSLNSRSMSLDNLANDSPVVSLLREYSDRLIGLVHTQVDGKIYETPTDTV